MFVKLPRVLLLVLALASAVSSARAEKLPPAIDWLPEQALAVIQVEQPKVILDAALNPGLQALLEATPEYRQALAAPQFVQFRAIVTYFEAKLGTDWRAAARKLLGGKLLLAAGPHNRVVLMLDTEDAELLGKLHSELVTTARADAAGKGREDKIKSADYQGVECWTFDGREAHAIVGNRLIMASHNEVLKAVLDLKANSGASLARSDFYKAAKAAVGDSAVAWAFANLSEVKQQPAFIEGLNRARNPAVTFLSAGLLDVARTSNWVAARIGYENGAARLTLLSDGRPGDDTGFAWAKSGDGAWPNLVVPRQLAGITLYRDLAGFYSQKDKLFPERTSGLVFFENMMEIFFSGRKLTDEVMGEAQPQIRLVAAAQKYDGAAPVVQVPALALVFRMKHPEQFSDVAEEAWQKGLGLLNFTRGQKALQGMIIDKPSHAGVTYSVAYFSKASAEDREHLPIRFNFRPALVKMGEYLVISSTDGLANDLIDALQKEKAAPPRPVSGVNTLLTLDAAQAAALVEVNRSALVADNMVKKGISRERANKEFDGVLMILKRLQSVSLSMGDKSQHTELTLEVKLNLP